MNNVMSYDNKKKEIIKIDEWIPEPEDQIIKHTKGVLIAPVSSVFNCVNNSFNYFVVSTKRCYDKAKMRDHMSHYINYFEKFYDQDKELIMIYSKIKYLIDFQTESYTKEAFIYDVLKYVLSPSIMYKVSLMNRDNYEINLSKNKGNNDPKTQYTNKHGFILMKISLIMNVCIPLLTHFIYAKKIQDTDEFLLEVYDRILYLDYFDANIYDKLYDTCDIKIEKSKKYIKLWDKQDIRGINDTIQKLYSIENILLNIMPKFVYNEHIIAFIDRSISLSMGYKIDKVGWEADFISLSSSKRDLDQNSEMDRFENSLTKENEALYIQNKVNCDKTMEMLLMTFPIEQAEVDFYVRELSKDTGNFVINGFQKELIFSMFYRYFGDTSSIKAINRDDYIKLMIIAKRKLLSYKMVILPYIIGGKINKLILRKNINKKELVRLESSEYFSIIKSNYRNDKIINHILSLIAAILASDFSIIDYYARDLNGQHIEVLPEVICEELLLYVSLI